MNAVSDPVADCRLWIVAYTRHDHHHYHVRQVCVYYGDLRDDYAVVNYGFLPPEEYPPRLCLADHPHYVDEYTTAIGSTTEDGFKGPLPNLKRLHGTVLIFALLVLAE